MNNDDDVYNEATNYNELQEYLNHQESWLEAEFGEQMYHAMKEELEDE